MPHCLGRVCALLSCVLLLQGITGCGGGGTGVGNVTGKVTYKGAPVTGGSIGFYYDNGKTAGGSINATGTYGIQAPASGKVKVTIDNSDLKPGTETSPAAESGMVYVKLPAKYADSKTTTLSFEVKSGNQTQNFDLTD